MPLAKKTIQNIINEYTDVVKVRLPDSRLYVFGSTARGERKTTSDIDLLIVSKEFGQFPGMERLILLSHLRRGLARKVPMDIIGLTPSEFQSLRGAKNSYWRSVIADCVSGEAVG